MANEIIKIGTLGDLTEMCKQANEIGMDKSTIIGMHQDGTLIAADPKPVIEPQASAIPTQPIESEYDDEYQPAPMHEIIDEICDVAASGYPLNITKKIFENHINEDGNSLSNIFLRDARSNNEQAAIGIAVAINEKKWQAKRQVINECLDKLEDMITFLIPNYVKEGKYNLVIAIGCTGGKHRSVTLASGLYDRMKDRKDIGFKLTHRDVNLT